MNTTKHLAQSLCKAVRSTPHEWANEKAAIVELQGWFHRPDWHTLIVKAPTKTKPPVIVAEYQGDCQTITFAWDGGDTLTFSEDGKTLEETSVEGSWNVFNTIRHKGDN